MEFKAITPLNNTDRLTFQWTISAGTIERGQGTQEIRVRAPRDLNNSIAITVTASVEISGLPKDCSRTAFEYAAVSSGFHPALIDEFGKLPANDIRGRLDAFLQEVTNNKKQVGFIALYFQRTKGEARLKQRLDLIVRHIKFRKFPIQRVVICSEPDEKEYTRLWRSDREYTEYFCPSRAIL